MANNKHFISPGVYSRIEDLSQATVSIGTTTLGVVGETLKGSAFQPMKIENKAQYFSLFGGTSPVKNGTNLRYETSYIADEFLNQSSSLYVTRILGLTGFKAHAGTEISFQTVGGDAVSVATLRHITGIVITLGAKKTYAETEIIATKGAEVKKYLVSFDKTSKKYISLVLPRLKTGEFYLENDYNNGYDILGTTATTITPIVTKGNFETEFKTPVSSVLVSDVATGVKDLFSFISISDGYSANHEIKVSIENLRVDTREFDVIIRDFKDSDKSPKILEAFRRCNMNPQSSNYVGKRIGSFDGMYTLYSKYVSVDINDDAPINAIPAGFKGLTGLKYTPTTNYVVDYTLAHVGSSPRELRQSYLGYDFSSNSLDMLHYQGYDGVGSNVVTTKGFHMEDLTGVTDAGQFVFNTGASLSGTPYDNILSRRFTLPLSGGFDGWDEHKDTRSFDNATSVNDGSYSAYLKGVELMMNPDELPINLFATGGIDYANQNNLVLEIIDLLENDRGDVFYVVNSPDVDNEIFDSSEVYASDLSSRLDATNIDTMYAGTYASWLNHYDSQNGVNVWLPPTFQVLSGMAESDRKGAPWFATAGYKNGKLRSNKSKVRLTQDASDILYDNRINPIRTYTNNPLLIMGNKSLLADEDSALNRINVVRLLLQIQKLVSVVAVRILFSPNDDEVQDEFIRAITPIMDSVQKQRGIIDYEIVCNSSNNSDADRDRLQLNGYIRIKPTTSLEYINVTYGVTDQGAVFSV